MRSLTQYYKNLCEDLQEKIEVLESLLNEAHPNTRADRRREAAKPSNDVREKIRKIEKTMGVLSKEGQSELFKITDNFSKWPGDGKVKRIFNNQGIKKSEKPKPSDRRREADSEDAMKMEETIINFLENMLNEAGYKKAIRSKNPEKLRKEIKRQAARGAYDPNWALRDDEIIASIGRKKYDAKMKRGRNIDNLRGQLFDVNDGLDEHDSDEIIHTVNDQVRSAKRRNKQTEINDVERVERKKEEVKSKPETKEMSPLIADFVETMRKAYGNRS